MRNCGLSCFPHLACWHWRTKFLLTPMCRADWCRRVHSPLRHNLESRTSRLRAALADYKLQLLGLQSTDAAESTKTGWLTSRRWAWHPPCLGSAASRESSDSVQCCLSRPDLRFASSHGRYSARLGILYHCLKQKLAFGAHRFRSKDRRLRVCSHSSYLLSRHSCHRLASTK